MLGCPQLIPIFPKNDQSMKPTSKAYPMAPSYQLPDLPNLVRSFELRTNPACRTVTKASESWLISAKSLSGCDLLSPLERDQLPAMKVGLLSASCFPGSDPTQLRLLTDVLTLIIISARRTKYLTAASQPSWGTAIDNDGILSLKNHELFSCLEERLDRISQKAEPSWKVRFDSSVKFFRRAQSSSVTESASATDPGVDSYVSANRDLTGLFMIFDLFEFTQNLTPAVNDETISKSLDNLKRLAVDIISSSQDVAAFNGDQAKGNERNLISHLMNHKHLPVQGALNHAGNLIKEYFDSFVEEERDLLDPMPPPPSNGSGIVPNWVPFTSLVASATAIQPVAHLDPVIKADLTAYVQLLRDCIVGTLNWIYETDIYFGKKGEEIRTFGWIFLSPKVQDDDEVVPVPGGNEV